MGCQIFLGSSYMEKWGIAAFVWGWKVLSHSTLLSSVFSLPDWLLHWLHFLF